MQRYNVGDIVKVQILHTADMHGRFVGYDYALDQKTTAGSLAAIASKVKQLRAECPLTYLIDTGDTFQGNYNELFLRDFSSSPMLKMMNYLAYDSFTLGNHEFNYGMPQVEQIIQLLHTPTLAANLYKTDGTRFAKPYVIVEQEGIRIAIVGMVTPNIVRWDSDHLEGIVVRMPLEEMQELWLELEGKADCYIFANHQSLHDFYVSGDGYEQLIAAYPQFKVILLSHSHQVRALVQDDRAFVQPGAFAAYLGRVLLHFERVEDGWCLHHMEAEVISLADVAEDAVCVGLAHSAHELAVADVRTPVGRLVGGDLIPRRILVKMSLAQVMMTPLIALINDVQRYYGEADVSLATLFHIDANLKEGEINRADIVNMYRHNNILRVYEMTGSQLRRLMEWGVRYFNQWQVGDLTISFNPNIPVYDYAQFGGIRYKINIAKPQGQRIEDVYWPDGSLLQDEQRIRVAMDDFRAKGFLEQDLFCGDTGVKLLKDFAHEYEDDGRIRHLISRYIEHQEQGTITNNFDERQNWYELIGYSWSEVLHQEAIRQLNSGIIPISQSSNGLSFHTQAVREEDLR